MFLPLLSALRVRKPSAETPDTVVVVACEIRAIYKDLQVKQKMGVQVLLKQFTINCFKDKD